MAMPKSAVNPLEDLYQLISRGAVQRDIVVARGDKTTTYTLRSLYDEDYTWRDQFVNMSSPAAMVSSQKSPTLAIATLAIDGIPVEQISDLQKMDDLDLPQSVKDSIREGAKYLPAYNLHTHVYSKLPRDYVVELYEKYLREVEAPARKVGTDEIKNS
jgi:hypothetical protein